MTTISHNNAKNRDMPLKTSYHAGLSKVTTFQSSFPETLLQDVSAEPPFSCSHALKTFAIESQH